MSVATILWMLFMVSAVSGADVAKEDPIASNITKENRNLTNENGLTISNETNSTLDGRREPRTKGVMSNTYNYTFTTTTTTRRPKLLPSNNFIKYVIVPRLHVQLQNSSLGTTNLTNGALDEIRDSLPGSESRTQIYIIGIVGILPAAGAIIWCVKYLMGKYKKQNNEDDEEDQQQQQQPQQRVMTSFVKPPDGYYPPNKAYSIKLPPEIYHATKIYASSKPPINIGPYKEQNEIEGSPGKCVYLLQYQQIASRWEFPRNSLYLTEVIGEGNFGQVWKAEARHLNGVPGAVIVAVKSVKANANSKEKQDLLKEMQIMQHLGRHNNVVTLLGCCTTQEPYYVVMEYVVRGKLLSFLRSHRSTKTYYNCHPTSQTLTSRDLTMFAYQVTQGMEYINSKGVIHRDLAARNILVDHNKVCKVADFGLARRIKDNHSEVYEQKSKGALPIRWMAPESLYMNVFTTKSDIWAFGILLWEIVTLGSTPYPGMGPREVIQYVREGLVMERPHHCRPELYKVIRGCWATDPHIRPHFNNLKNDLGKLLELQTGYVDLEHFPENFYYNLYQSPGEKV